MVFLPRTPPCLTAIPSQSEIILQLTPAANRTQPDLEELIGLFSNPLVMRVTFSKNLSLRSLLEQVKELFVGSV